LRGSSRKPPGCRPTNTSSCAALNGPSCSCKQGRSLSRPEVAVGTRLSDQSQFSYHFKRIVGGAPRQFRTPSRIA
jgi:hypothetical protein